MEQGGAVCAGHAARQLVIRVARMLRGKLAPVRIAGIEIVDGEGYHPAAFRPQAAGQVAGECRLARALAALDAGDGGLSAPAQAMEDLGEGIEATFQLLGGIIKYRLASRANAVSGSVFHTAK